MPVLNFKEIPLANVGSGQQDQFELFTRDFLAHLGYIVAVGPDRGADSGRDLVVHERRVGPGGETVIRWLVSSKHKAHSGGSVTSTDEQNIRDRVETHKCNGFLCCYSTLPSSSLAKILERLRDSIDVQIFDHEKIESHLLGSSKGLLLAERFFPESIRKWKVENPKPAKIFAEMPSLECAHCGRELLDQQADGIIVFWKRRHQTEDEDQDFVEEIYWCCKGYCDKVLSATRRASGWVDSWEDIPDVMIPLVFCRWIVAPLNKLRTGTRYSDAAFEQLKEFILNIFPHVARHPTKKEKERMKGLLGIPSWMGGFGYP
jgi:hypothetical protein